MGAIRSALEYAGPAYKEWLSRFERDWKYEPLKPESARFYGADIPETTRSIIAHDVLRLINGKRLEAYSEEENIALTAGLVSRFKAWAAHRDSIARYDLESEDEDFKWQQDALDDAERIMQGYVNLVCAINFDFRTFTDGKNLQRVEEFFEEESSSIVSAFENHGGKQAFLAKTLGLPSSSRAGAVIYDDLSAQDLGLDLPRR